MSLSSRKIVICGIIPLIVTLFGLLTLRSSLHHVSDMRVTSNSSVNAPIHRLLMKTQRSVKSVETVNLNKSSTDRNVRDRLTNLLATTLEDVFISIKTTAKYHRTRMSILLDTWASTALNQIYIFTDEDDDMLVKKSLPAGHVINTKCNSDHSRKGLNCKMGQEFDLFVTRGERWFCHVDDDNYVNTERLVSMLGNYNHTEDWYLGKPSFDHPMKAKDRSRPGQNLKYWFATGGAGICISRALALKMIPHAGGGRLMRVGEHIGQGDDCTIGYIINNLLRTELTVIKEFHSHLEPLAHIRTSQIVEQVIRSERQITFGYSLKNGSHNVVNVRGFSEEKDPTRFWSIHCHLHPLTKACLDHK